MMIKSKVIVWKNIYKVTKYLADKLRLILLHETKEIKLKMFFEKIYPLKTDKDLVRVGPDYDGGYLIPNDLEDIAICVSPGVDSESRFELELANKGMKVYMADNSVDSPAINHSNFHFIKKHIGSYSNQNQISFDVWLRDIFKDSKNSDSILQMDIEGAEIETLLSISEDYLNNFRIIVIEFHDFSRLFVKDFFEIYEIIFNKLLKNHSVVHIHPNNTSKIHRRGDIEIPDLFEITFHRNDRFVRTGYASKFPHNLDRANISFVKDLKLPKCWYFHND